MEILSFDLDGTLVYPDYSDLVWRTAIPELVAMKRSIDIEEAKEFVYAEYDSIGDERMEWYKIDYWFNRFGLEDNWKEIMELYSDRIKPYPEVIDVLNRLKDKFTLVIISNASREFIRIEMERTGIDNYISMVFSATTDFMEVKKTGRFYKRVCEILNIPPKDLIHVGDHWHFDYLIPRQIGIKAFYLDRKGERFNQDGVIRNLLELEERLLNW
jgi:putative hydrolase of the HAD superfamily